MKEKIFIAGGHPDDLIGAAGFALLNKNDCLVKNKLLDAAFRGNQIHVKYAEAFAAFLPGNGNKTCIFQKE